MAGSVTAIVMIGGDTKGLDGALTTARSKVAKFGQGLKRELGKSIRGAFDGLKDIAGFAGVAGLAVATKQVMDFEKRMLSLRLNASATAGDMASLKQQIFAVAQSEAIDPEALLGGVEEYVKLTGNLDEARGSLKAFATVAAVTGTEASALTATAAALAQQMKIDPSKMEEALGTLYTQGKKGSVELKETATLMPQLAASFQRFGTTGTAGVAQLGAYLQVIKRGFGTSSEAATGFESLMGSLVKKQSQLKKIGVNVFDDKGNFRSFDTIIRELLKATGGSSKKLAEILKDKESITAIEAIKGGLEDIEKLTNAGAGDMQADRATYLESSAAAMERSSAAIKKTFNDLLAKNLGSIAKAFQLIADAVKFIADRPKATLAALALLKGGGILSRAGAAAGGVEGALAAAAGGGAGGPAYGPAERMGLRPGSRMLAGAVNANTPGNMMTGAAIGVAVSQTLGDGLGGVAQSAIVATHALAGLSGPVGLLFKAFQVAADAFMAWTDEHFKDKHAAILNAKIGAFGFQSGADAVTGSDPTAVRDTARRAREAGLIDANGNLVADTGAIWAKETGRVDPSKIPGANFLGGEERTKGAQNMREIVYETMLKALAANPAFRERALEVKVTGQIKGGDIGLAGERDRNQLRSP
ncbi:MAG: phage tail tape measure protein [Baekduiaceae bacterium]